MIKQVVRKEFLAVIIIILLIIPIKGIPNAQANPQFLDKIILMIARYILMEGIKELIKYNINNVDTWNIADASNVTATGMANQIAVPFEEATNSFKHVAEKVTMEFGKTTHESLILQTAEKYENDAAIALQGLGVDINKLIWEYVQIDTGAILSTVDIDNNGFPHIVYKDIFQEPEIEVKYTFLDDLGKHTQLISRPGYYYNEADIKLDSKGNAHLVYSEYGPKNQPARNRQSLLWYVILDGKTAKRPIDETYDISEVSLALDSLNHPHICYNYTARAGNQATDVSIKYATWNGASWEKEKIELFPLNAKADMFFPSIAVDKKNVPHVTFYFEGTLKYAKRIGDRIWEVEYIDFSRKPGQYSLEGGSYFALDSTGFPHVIYTNPRDNQVNYAYLDRKMNKWSYQTVESYGLLTLDDNDVAYILYDYDMKIGIWNRIDWLPIPIYSPERTFFKSFALDDKGYAHIFYTPDPDKVKPTPFIYAKSSFPITKLAKLLETPWDVNNDGEINISDLVLVGRHFGETGKVVVGDVNSDGTVDLLDLVLVGRHLGESVGQ